MPKAYPLISRGLNATSEKVVEIQSKKHVSMDLNSPVQDLRIAHHDLNTYQGISCMWYSSINIIL